MDLSEDIAIGQVVKSKAGRDKGRVFLVLNIIDKENVLIVDGDLRKLENPKQKKLKHLVIYKTILSQLEQNLDDKNALNNSYIKKLLEPYKGF